jgi:U3 small nucleolar RNA-associated protein 22
MLSELTAALTAHLRRAGATGRGHHGMAPTVDGEQPITPPPASARAVLDHIPARVVASHTPEELRRELLVGFDPLQLLLARLEERFGHLATFCADTVGGAAVALRWAPQAFGPAPLRVATAHCTLQPALSGRGPVGSVLPNVPQVLQEMQTLGLGLLEAVVLAPKC